MITLSLLPIAAMSGAGSSGSGPATWKAFVDMSHRFAIRHPDGFVVQAQDVSRLPRFEPSPLAVVFVMNPTMATGALAGVEPPDLQVRVYRANGEKNLKTWLQAVGFARADSQVALKPYRNANVSGLELCSPTLAAPGCSVYVLGRGRVYQLTPISLEGNAMMETFTVLP